MSAAGRLFSICAINAGCWFVGGDDLTVALHVLYSSLVTIKFRMETGTSLHGLSSKIAVKPLVSSSSSSSTVYAQIITLHASCAQCIVIGPVCLWVGESVTMITQSCIHRSSPNWVCR